MSALNILIAKVSCPNCQQGQDCRIQFKYGDAAFDVYHLGDTLKWGRNNIGSPDFKRVMVYGIAESTVCSYCESDCLIEEFDIFVENNIIVDLTPMQNIRRYLDDSVAGEYVVLE